MIKIPNFGKHQLLNNQIDRLTEVWDRMNTRSQCRHTQQPRPYKPYVHRGKGRGYRQFCRYDRGMGKYRQSSYDRNRRGYSSSRSLSRGCNTPRGSYHRQDNYICRSDSIPEVIAQPDPLLEGPKWYLGHPFGICQMISLQAIWLFSRVCT